MSGQQNQTNELSVRREVSFAKDDSPKIQTASHNILQPIENASYQA